jgi:hypothetical protein
VSQNYRIPSSGLSRGHPVDQVKMKKKKIAVTEKNIKIANKLGKNEEGIPQFFLESKIIAPVLPRILKH